MAPGIRNFASLLPAAAIFALLHCAPRITDGNDLGLGLLASAVALANSNCATASISAGMEPYFVVNGRDWNDYVTGAGNFRALEDAPCTAMTGESCLHAAPFRAADLSSAFTSCEGLTISDELGVLRWLCDSSSGRPRAISTGFQAGKGLADLLDFDAIAWRVNSVRVSDACGTISSGPSSRWWSNDVSRPTGGVVQNAVAGSRGGVFLVDETNNVNTSFNSNTIEKIAVVVRPGVRLDGNTGVTYAVTAAGQYIWLEGDIRARNNNDYAVFVDGANYVELRNLRLDNSNGSGQTAGLGIENASHVFGENIAAANFQSPGIGVSGSSKMRLMNIRAYTNQGPGFEVLNSTDVVALNVLSASNDGSGVLLENGGNHVVGNVTSALNDVNAGIRLVNAGFITVYNSVSVNNSTSGMAIESVNPNTMLNAVSTRNTGTEITLTGSSAAYFTGFLKVNLGNCSGSAAAGLNTGCAPSALSDFGTVETGTDLTNDFQAKIEFDEPINPSDDGLGNGTANLASITDWWNFAHEQRVWGFNGGAFINATNRGACDAGTPCRIWDWSLRSNSGTNLRNAIPYPSGDSTLTYMNSGGDTTTHLRGALEIIGDGIGDDDGLCESNETCLVTPNVGAYQGHGNLVSAGDFADGTVIGVTLMRYSDNGR